MKNTSEDLNNYLFESIERLMEANNKELDKEIERAKTVCTVAKNIINNGNVQLKATRLAFDHGVNTVPKNLLPNSKRQRQ